MRAERTRACSKAPPRVRPPLSARSALRGMDDGSIRVMPRRPAVSGPAIEDNMVGAVTRPGMLRQTYVGQRLRKAQQSRTDVNRTRGYFLRRSEWGSCNERD